MINTFSFQFCDQKDCVCKKEIQGATGFQFNINSNHFTGLLKRDLASFAASITIFDSKDNLILNINNPMLSRDEVILLILHSAKDLLNAVMQH